MPVILFVGMKCRLGGWQGKNEPAVAGIDRGKIEDVAKELAVLFSIFAVDDDVSASEHDDLRSKGAGSTFEARSYFNPSAIAEQSPAAESRWSLRRWCRTGRRDKTFPRDSL